MNEYALDCKGQKCPMPIVNVFKKIKSIEINDILIIESDDRAFIPDIRAWCKKTGQELIKIYPGQISKAVIKKVC